MEELTLVWIDFHYFFLIIFFNYLIWLRICTKGSRINRIDFFFPPAKREMSSPNVKLLFCWFFSPTPIVTIHLHTFFFPPLSLSVCVLCDKIGRPVYSVCLSSCHFSFQVLCENKLWERDRMCVGGSLNGRNYLFILTPTS